MRKTMKTGAAILAIVILAGFAGWWVSSHLATKPKTELHLATGSMLPTPMKVKAFHLKSGHQAMGMQQLKGQWHVVFFGFSRCPMLCPTTLSMLNRVVSRMPSEPAIPQVWFVSVDSEHDTPQAADHYAKSFNHAFVGLAGSAEAIKSLAKQMNVAYGPVVTMDREHHQVRSINHSGYLAIVNPRGDVVAFLTRPNNENDVLTDLKAIIQQG